MMQNNGSKSNGMPEKPEIEPITEPSESAVKEEKQLKMDISPQTKSRRKGSSNTPLPIRLSFVQVAIFEYQKNGGKVRISKLPRKDGEKPKIGIILDDVDIIDQSFVAI